MVMSGMSRDRDPVCHEPDTVARSTVARSRRSSRSAGCRLHLGKEPTTSIPRISRGGMCDMCVRPVRAKGPPGFLHAAVRILLARRIGRLDNSQRNGTEGGSLEGSDLNCTASFRLPRFQTLERRLVYHQLNRRPITRKPGPPGQCPKLPNGCTAAHHGQPPYLRERMAARVPGALG